MIFTHEMSYQVKFGPNLIPKWYPNGLSKMLGMNGYKDNQFLRQVGIGFWVLPIPKPKILGFGFGYLFGYGTLVRPPGDFLIEVLSKGNATHCNLVQHFLLFWSLHAAVGSL